MSKSGAMNRAKMRNDNDPPDTGQKIPPGKVSAGIRPDEIGRILNLKRDLDYSDVLSKFAYRYLQIGWDLVAVNPKGAVELDLDFHQPQGIWSRRLADLGMEGVQVNLGVRTGAASNLLVLEVRPRDGVLPFVNGDEWRSGCVAEAGDGWEQHYYVLPQGWPAPSSCYLDPHRLKVFGAGGLVLAPPSLEPRVQENLRWLRPPWESPPCRPSPRLWQFLMEHIPNLAPPAVEPMEPMENEPLVPAWEDIYGTISVHPTVLQILLAPAGSPEEYYLQILQAALESGLTDPDVLLGLLWHAPLGDARSRPQGRQELKNLIAGAQKKDDSQAALEKVTTLLQELQGAFAALSEAGVTPPVAIPKPPPPPPPPPPPVTYNYPPPTPEPEVWPAQGPGGRYPHPGHTQTLPEIYNQAAAMRVLWRPRESINVERDRYEAMLYELGKLGAMTDIQQDFSRENKTLREKIEAQQQKEISRLRRLCSQNQNQLNQQQLHQQQNNQQNSNPSTINKKDKGWWR